MAFVWLPACRLSHFSRVQLFATLCTVAPRLLFPWDSPGKITGVGCHALLQWIFPTQELNPHLMSPAMAGTFLTTSTTWESRWPLKIPNNCINFKSKVIYHQFKKILSKTSHFIQFSYSVVSDSLLPHGLQHARPPCPSPTPGLYSNSCPLSQRCHPTISSSVVPFCSCPQSFPESGSFQISQPFASGGQSIGVSASTSVLPMNTQDWSPLGWTGLISLLCKGLSRVFSNTTVQSINSLALSFGYGPTLTSIHDYWKAIVSSHFIRVGTLTTKVSSNQKFSYHVRTQSWSSESGTQA